MSTVHLRRLVLGGWLTILAACAVVLTTLQVPIGGLTAVIILLAAIGGPAILLSRIWRDDPQTIAQVLHPLEASHSGDERTSSSWTRGGRS